MGLADLWGGEIGGPQRAYYGGDPNGANNAANYYGGQGGAAQDRGGVQMGSGGYGADASGYQGQYGQDSANAAGARGDESDALGLMRAAAEGKAPSAAQTQMSAGVDQALKAQMAAAASARGGGPAIAAAQRQAALNSGDMQMQAVNQGAQLRAQEMAQARGQFMQGAEGMRGQDLQSRAQALQGMGMSYDQAFRQAQLEAQQRGMNDQYSLGMYNLQNQVRGQQLGADQGYAQLGQQGQEFNAQQGTNLLLGGMGMAGGLAMMSDARAKRAVTPMGECLGCNNERHAMSEGTKIVSDARDKTDIDRMLERVEPVSYDYKNPARDGVGRQYGVLAQHLERSPMGASMVEDTPRGKMVHTGKAALGGLAALAELHHRVSALEARR